MTDFLLEARHVTKRLPSPAPGLPPPVLVRDISLGVQAGEFITITGPSGSGKSSLLYLLGLLDRPNEGDILLKGQPTGAMASDDLAGLRLLHMGFVFQFHFLLPEFTALENVLIPMRKLGGRSRKDMLERAEFLLTDLGLADQMRTRPGQMSGGQRQRVAIARALANNPSLILADEPTGNLDSKSAQHVFSILRTLAESGERAVLAVTHDQELARTAHRNVHLVDGAITA